MRDTHSNLYLMLKKYSNPGDIAQHDWINVYTELRMPFDAMKSNIFLQIKYNILFKVWS